MKKLLPFLILLIFFLFLFFFFRNKLLFTPDFGESDIYHGYGFRFYMSQGLKANHIPFWTDKIQGGFPFFSEWQSGSLFIPNLIFFRLFSFSNAYNLTYVFSFFLLSAGFYLLLREFDIDLILALLISLNFAFNGSLVFRLTHVSVIQTFAMTPLLFYLGLRFIKSKKTYLLIFISLLVSQMILAGFPPLLFMISMGFYLFIFIYLKTFKKTDTVLILKIIFIFILTFLAGILLSSAQILPSLLLSQNSVRGVALDYSVVTDFPLQIKNIVNFVFPFFFGNPKYGTYPPFSSEWGIFWENTPYIGLINGLLLFSGLIYVFFFFKKKTFIILNLLIAILFFLLALGKNSPFYFLFEFPPFNFFRTQSRYLIMVNFFIFLVIAFSVNQFIKHKIIFNLLIWMLLFIGFVDLLMIGYNYHSFIDAKKVFEKPELSLKINDSYYYQTFGQEEMWNNIFEKKGWSTKEDIDKYIFYKNFLYPNSNLLFGKRIFDYSNGVGFKLKRSDYLKNLLKSNYEIKDQKFNLSDNSLNLMQLLGMRYLIMPWDASSNLKRIDQAIFKNEKIYLYELKGVSSNLNPLIYFPKSTKLIYSLKDFEGMVNEGNNFIENSAVEDPGLSGIKNNNVKITKMFSGEEKMSFTGYFSGETLTVFKKNYYPEWSAYIDGKKTQIYKVNLVNMGIIVPNGVHTIILKYDNKLFKAGIAISMISFLIFLIVIKKLKIL